MSSRDAPENRFLTAPIARVFIAQAVPMMLVMTMGGLQNIVDAVFLGRFVGTGALAAVSVIFPVLMTIIALSTLVSGGMSSLLARALGAGDMDRAGSVFAGAHGLGLCIALFLNLAFAAFGTLAIVFLSDGEIAIAAMARTYLGITVVATPLQFLLAVHSDAWRNEGRASLIAMLSVGVTLANIALTYVLIVWADLGVAGSALGTVAAQGLGFTLLVGLRLAGGGTMRPGTLLRHSWLKNWLQILPLGAPMCLSFIGIALVSAIVVGTLRVAAGEAFAETVAAYGIVTRIMTFTYLPFMAISFAMQAVVGNNVGAQLYTRSDATLRLAAVVAFVYGLAIEAVLMGLGARIGWLFADDPAVVAAVGSIVPRMMMLYLFTGPVLVLAIYFQAVGQPLRTAALTLAKPFLLSPVLVITLGSRFGTPVVWYAFPLGDALVVAIAVMITVASLRRTDGPGFGLSAGRAA